MENINSDFLRQHAKIAGNIANRVYTSYEEYENACLEQGIMYAEKYAKDYFNTVDI